MLAILALTGCAQFQERQFINRMKNKPAQDFELTALDGEKVRLSDYRGQRVLLAFWAFG